MNETARDYAETKRGLKNQIQERGFTLSVVKTSLILGVGAMQSGTVHVPVTCNLLDELNGSRFWRNWRER